MLRAGHISFAGEHVLVLGNGGVSQTRNIGLAAAKGDYIGFVDSDDFIAPEMYEKLCVAITESENSVEISSCMVLSYKREKSKKSIVDFKKRWVIKQNRQIRAECFAKELLTEKVNFTVWSKLYNAELLKIIRFREGKINEDTLFIFDISRIIEQRKVSMIEIPYKGYYYRQRANSICSNKKKPLALDTIDNYVMMRDYYAKINNMEMEYVLTRYLAWRYIRFANQVIRNEQWYALYYKEAQRNIKSLKIANVLSYRFQLKVLLRFFMLRYIPNVYASYVQLRNRHEATVH